jgi:hypothetical protein
MVRTIVNLPSPTVDKTVSDDKKGHLDADRLDSVTIIPPPDGDMEGLRFSESSLRPNYILCLKDIQAPQDCPHLDHLVDYVHDF